MFKHVNDSALRVYLNDHLAGSIYGSQVARELLTHRPDGALAEFLRAFLLELSEERAVLVELMALVGAPLNPFKLVVAWGLEKLVNLKLRQFFLRFTDASRFNALESLCLGVEAKRLMWRTLADLSVRDVRLADFDFRRLSARALEQEAVLRLFRQRAAAEAFHGREVFMGLREASSAAP